MENVKLTKRQEEVYRLVLAGLSHQEIASQLDITIYSVKFHLGIILNKFGCRTKAELISLALTTSGNGLSHVGHALVKQEAKASYTVDDLMTAGQKLVKFGLASQNQIDKLLGDLILALESD